MTVYEAIEHLRDISWIFGSMGVEYLTEEDGRKMRDAIDVLANALEEDN